MKIYDIDIFRLSNATHRFEFEIDQAFFQSRDQELVDNGTIRVQIDLDKNDRFISMEFKLQGTVQLICDRSLDPFGYALDEQRKVIFKYGDQEMELSEDMMMITAHTQHINVAQYIFEFIGLALPMKKLHPRYQQDDLDENTLVYSSLPQQEFNREDSDPRWSELKRLKKN